MCSKAPVDSPLREALHHLRSALVHLDAAEQHSAAARVDHIIHELEAKANDAPGRS